MNAVWSRVLRSVYRREPITGFVLIAGAIDVAIGGIGSHSSLVFLGLSAVGTALALRWWQHSQRPSTLRSTITPPEKRPRYALPPAEDSLPPLSMPRKPSRR